jgi:competence protein ComEC
MTAPSGERSVGRGRAFGGASAERLTFSLEASLVAERSRWFLWTPVVFAIGIGLYFALPYEPALWPGFAVFAAAAIFARMVRAFLPLFLIALAVAIAGAGFGIATIRTEMVAAPVLEKNINRASVTGKVINVETRRVGQRFVLADATIRGLDPFNTPKRIRLSDRIGDSGLMPGDLISVRIRLHAAFLCAAARPADLPRRRAVWRAC